LFLWDLTLDKYRVIIVKNKILSFHNFFWVPGKKEKMMTDLFEGLRQELLLRLQRFQTDILMIIKMMERFQTGFLKEIDELFEIYYKKMGTARQSQEQEEEILHLQKKEKPSFRWRKKEKETKKKSQEDKKNSSGRKSIKGKVNWMGGILYFLEQAGRPLDTKEILKKFQEQGVPKTRFGGIYYALKRLLQKKRIRRNRDGKYELLK